MFLAASLIRDYWTNQDVIGERDQHFDRFIIQERMGKEEQKAKFLNKERMLEEFQRDLCFSMHA